MMIGKPYWSVNVLTSSYLATAPWVPGTVGTSDLWARSRAETLSPKLSIVSAFGPTNYCSLRKLTLSSKVIAEPLGQTHNETRIFDLAREFCVLGQKSIARVYHVRAMLFRNPDDLVLGKISLHRSELPPRTKDISLVGLLPVHAEAVLIAVDGDGLERKLVGSTEDSNRNFAAICNCACVS